MGKLRVVLAHVPRILGDILKDLVERQPNMAIVGEVRSLVELPQAIASLRAEAVILTVSPPGVGRSVCSALRELHPAPTILGLVLPCDKIIVWPTDAPPQHVQMTASSILGALRGRVGMDLRNDRRWTRLRGLPFLPLHFRSWLRCGQPKGESATGRPLALRYRYPPDLEIVEVSPPETYAYRGGG